VQNQTNLEMQYPHLISQLSALILHLVDIYMAQCFRFTVLLGLHLLSETENSIRNVQANLI
jgi:hypothetical protein